MKYNRCFGLVLILGIAWLVMIEKKVKYRPIITMVILQFILGFLLLNTSVGNILISGIADGLESY